MLRVLIAEDEEMIRKGLVYTTDWLSMDCVVVAEAADGQDGYEKILEHRPDVVITDICMPFMDGIEMIKKASEQVRFKSILLTSYADFEYARRAIEASLDACRDLYLQGLRSAARLVRVLDRDGLFAAMNGLIEGYLDLRI